MMRLSPSDNRILATPLARPFFAQSPVCQSVLFPSLFEKLCTECIAAYGP